MCVCVCMCVGVGVCVYAYINICVYIYITLYRRLITALDYITKLGFVFLKKLSRIVYTSLNRGGYGTFYLTFMKYGRVYFRILRRLKSSLSWCNSSQSLSARPREFYHPRAKKVVLLRVP